MPDIRFIEQYNNTTDQPYVEITEMSDWFYVSDEEYSLTLKNIREYNEYLADRGVSFGIYIIEKMKHDRINKIKNWKT